MKVLRRIDELREALEPYRVGSTIGLVPTMGAFHDGHRSLFAAARAECDVVVASLFVNPSQFDDRTDLEDYPHNEDSDARVAEESGVDILFAPEADEMYPDGYQTWVDVTELGHVLEGAFRPGHFRGVATVCLKLFNVVRPERAYFGQKDAQQAAVVEQLVRDLALPLEIRVVPTVREADGLALSSRNAYLSPEQREAARALPAALLAGVAAHRQGEDAAEAARTALAKEQLLAPDYVEVARLNGRTYLLAAVRAGDTRLIDNVVLEGEKQ
jgi:pantoate--beta-alanine ligase